jgi:GTP-binding protein HflX
MIERQIETETAVLIGFEKPGDTTAAVRESLEELASLVRTLGLEPLRSEVVKLRETRPKYLAGSGKAHEISEIAHELNADCLIFDDELSPSQQRNWDKLSGIAALDRHSVILDIFADHAQTKEARLQIELAQLEYTLPRLTNAWTHLSRQRGGARGTRGEGETQLEMDRRTILRRIHKMKEELDSVRSGRRTMRKQRGAVPVPTGAIVGYTNAGKSSLLRLLTGADVLVEDKLFATLDPTTRRVDLETGAEVVLTDTVGFIRRLPHDLVEAFKSTLEEATLADFLVQVLDASDPHVEHHYQVTREVLSELGAADKPVITVCNKVDRSNDRNDFGDRLDFVTRLDGPVVYLSAKTGEGADELRAAIQQVIQRRFETVRFAFPSARYDMASKLYEHGEVLKADYEGDSMIVVARVPNRVKTQLADYLSDAADASQSA